MDSKTIATAIIALSIGALGGYAIHGPERPDTSQHMMGNSSMGMGGAMDSMMQGLSGKSGDEFDKAFLEEMITHHEGAVSMAQAALTHAKHEEIKTMAQAIIDAQTQEIKQMKEWEASWYSE